MFTERKTKHLFHFVMFVITGGLWLPVWFLCWWANARHNDRMQAHFRELVAATRAPVNVTVTQTTGGPASQSGKALPVMFHALAATALLALFLLMALTHAGHI